MCVNGLLPDEVDEESCGNFLTFIVPAPKGCNLKCSFCFIRQRREGEHRESVDSALRPEDLERFIDEMRQQGPIVALAVQGHEPLLSESLPFTEAVLTKGRTLGLPTGLVTNGVRLSASLKLLRKCAPSKMAVSLDAASPKIHDHIRGLEGAWAASVQGIKDANKSLCGQTQLAVASVLAPAASSHLVNMPEFLNELGVADWIVNPQLKIARDKEARLKSDRERILQELLPLQEAAKAAQIRLTVDDEFDCFQLGAGNEIGSKRPNIRIIPKTIEVFRLSPGGQCSIGREILKPVALTTRRWRPGHVHAADLIYQKLAA
jgi:MoaA/NifB/PqqE/SkfB family radical SAM enzyme